MRPVERGTNEPVLPGFEPPADDRALGQDEAMVALPPETGAAALEEAVDDGRETMGGAPPEFLARGLRRRRAPLVLPPPRGFRWPRLRFGWGATQGPGPSKIRYRLKRAWAKPAIRSAVMVYAPLAALGLAGWAVISDDGLRRGAESAVADAWSAFAARPEFALKGLVVTGAAPHLQTEVQKAIGLEAGASSIGLDVAALREQVTAIGGVGDASVHIDPAGVLRVHVTPRPAAALWRDGAGHLFTVAIDGTMVNPVPSRAALPALPVLIGPGARDAVGEALDLLRRAPETVPRLRALIRVGERRWDMVLDRGLTIMLPAEKPADALAQILARQRDEILERDLAVVDLRLAHRPTLRLTPRAIEALRLTGALAQSEGKDL